MASSIDRFAARRVLVVDDDPLIRRLLRAVLQTQDYQIVEAPDGASALELAAARTPDVVILDVMMPGTSGFEVCRALRADRRFDRTRIVMLTARATDADRDEGARAGADAYFTKPFSPLDLIETVTGVRDGAA